MRKIILLTILVMIATTGCSTRNPEAPEANETHPPRYLLEHAAEAAADLESCKTCHGRDFAGTGNPVPGCFTCHDGGPPFTVHPLPFADPLQHGASAKANQLLCRGCHGTAPNSFNGGILADPDLFNSTAANCSASTCHPAARAHPTNWQGANEDIDPSYASTHRTVSQTAVNTGCVLCHNTTGPGAGPMVGAPSCYSASFTNSDGITSGCHTGGFNQPPHSIPYLDAASHGPDAKADLTACQQCHGIPGTTEFEGGIAPTGCSAAGCHPVAGSHPIRWEGSNDITPDYLSTHRTAGRTSTACAVCHNVAADAPGPKSGAPSCFTAGFTNSDGVSSACHAGGPTAPHAIPYTNEAQHGPDAKADLAACQQCHGNPGTIQFNGGAASTGCSTAGCHSDAGAHPTRWQGTNDASPSYLSTHRNAGNQSSTCSICHDFTAGRSAPHPSAPSCFSTGFTNSDGVSSSCHAAGPTAPHPLPYLDGGLHGPEAKNDLDYCKTCHASPSDAGAGDNPRFTVAIGNLTNGCEDCHSVNTAHPTPLWSGTPSNSHKTAGQLDTACALCHGATLTGGIGPACSSCHRAGDPRFDTNCTSCHNDPPDDSLPAGAVRPNRNGSHSVHDALAGVSGQCIACHNGFGTDTPVHYDENEPADISLLPAYRAQTGTPAYNATGNSCSGVSCHGGKTTPDWTAGTIDVDTDCLSCHAVEVQQYNSPQSGRHRKHVVEEGYHCTQCHNVNDPVSDPVDGSVEPLTLNHFAGLDTIAFEGDPSRTIRHYMNYNTAVPQPTCTFGPLARCHGTNEHNSPTRW